jgi:hypothetical protein
MTRAEALAALIAKAAAGTVSHATFEDLAVQAFGFGDAAINAGQAYGRGSLDAAKSLHEAVLPEWEWTIFFNNTTGHMAVLDGPDFSTPEIGSESPARAWLLAILRALHAMEGAKS